MNGCEFKTWVNSVFALIKAGTVLVGTIAFFIVVFSAGDSVYEGSPKTVIISFLVVVLCAAVSRTVVFLESLPASVRVIHDSKKI